MKPYKKILCLSTMLVLLGSFSLAQKFHAEPPVLKPTASLSAAVDSMASPTKSVDKGTAWLAKPSLEICLNASSAEDAAKYSRKASD